MTHKSHCLYYRLIQFHLTNPKHKLIYGNHLKRAMKRKKTTPVVINYAETVSLTVEKVVPSYKLCHAGPFHRFVQSSLCPG